MRTYLLTLTAVLSGLSLIGTGLAQEAVSSQSAPAKTITDTELYDLAYKFRPEQTFHTKVVHLVTVETTIRGATQVAKTRSVSTKTWKILSVAEDGKTTFVHSVDHVDMWQSVTGRQEVKYNSETDKTPPPGYELVATSVGVPLATVTMDRHGRVLERKNTHSQFNPGIGELTIPLPQQKVKVGTKWSMPDEVRLKQDNGQVKKIQVSQVYRLLKVETGVATISMETQVITPVDDPKLKSELVQRLQRGTIKFDLDAGRLLHKQMDMSETVLGFNGADSQMEYLARFTEEPTAGHATAELPGKEPAKSR
ncbi:hypothetical protein ETAA8_61500 [Anatilimnocola aggregata]|uniref:MucB/RseB N-terminal domain-containing protein n=1 Tax=Anatilimnocola aggregata TaxID=2528021 RepID=A0A517YL90_9BACT|nr:hypothetical protein [Anatilimnocola aggregata]QDU30997.1 hypothetical protein ETAA8_61500 [Anatilimnocola aggregata]